MGKKRLSIESTVEKIRSSLNARMDEEPASWITLKNGEHVPLNEAGEAIGGAGGWAKGKTFSKAKASGSTKSGKKPATKKMKYTMGGKEHEAEIPLVDNTSGTNKKSAIQLGALDKQLDDNKDDYHLNEAIRNVINEESAVMLFPQHAKAFGDGVQCKSANDKKDHVNHLLDEAIQEYNSQIAYLKSDDGYDQEIEEAEKHLAYYKGLKDTLNKASTARKSARRKNKWEKETGGTWEPMTGKQFGSLETGRMLAYKDGGYARVVKSKDGPAIEVGKYHIMPLTKENMKDYMWTDWIKPESPFADDRKMRFRL